MHDVLREAGEPVQRLRTIEIASHRNDSFGTQQRMPVLRVGQRVNAPTPPQCTHHAQSDIATADDQ